MIIRAILPEWAKEDSYLASVIEGDFNEDEIQRLNKKNYNIYFLPNYPKLYEGGNVSGFQIDTFTSVFIDMDLKDKVYATKEDFLDKLIDFKLRPSRIVDSGNGIHAYWNVSDLDAMSYLKLSRRLVRYFNTDKAVGKIYQLMRVPNTNNTKIKGDFKRCEVVFECPDVYTSEYFDKVLPILTQEDEQFCNYHYGITYNKDELNTAVDYKIPLKFANLLDSNKEVKEIWVGETDDRSKGDFRLGHIMFANGFSKEEAISVLVHTSKASTRSPMHQITYAKNIVDKIWTYEITQHRNQLNLSVSVRTILEKAGDHLKGTRFPCYNYFDDTINGFRLGQVIGLVAGVGVGKTAVSLNMFMGFVKNNPDYTHFFVPLEQPANEIAERWKQLCGDNTQLYDKVEVISNYDDTGTFRHLSLDDIKTYILKFQTITGKKAGCVVIDHIGVLKKKGKNGENQDLMDICHSMKSFAIETNTMLVMQSQAPREKAGIGDIELDKDSAYGTVYFESYCDYLVTIWQPLKRCYAEGAPTSTAFKFCKIRHKSQSKDKIKEDVCYALMFNPDTQHLEPMTNIQEESFKYFLNQATNKRKKDKKTDLVEYTKIVTTGVFGGTDGTTKVSNHKNNTRIN